VSYTHSDGNGSTTDAILAAGRLRGYMPEARIEVSWGTDGGNLSAFSLNNDFRSSVAHTGWLKPFVELNDGLRRERFVAERLLTNVFGRMHGHTGTLRIGRGTRGARYVQITAELITEVRRHVWLPSYKQLPPRSMDRNQDIVALAEAMEELLTRP
jgi:hypothetical protein